MHIYGNNWIDIQEVEVEIINIEVKLTEQDMKDAFNIIPFELNQIYFSFEFCISAMF